MPKPHTLRALRHLLTWHVTSQHVARRNALVASTALADRRRQRVEVEEFLDAMSAGTEGPGIRAVGHR